MTASVSAEDRPRSGAGARPAPAGLLTWVVSLGATVASTYALDAFAAAAGTAAVASGLLARLATQALVALLVLSYAAWGWGLRANVRANWALLTATGTSTNILSKVAYEVARRRRAGVRAQRMAAGSGYVGTELAKEVPYYLGAFGAAVLTDSITAGQALVFLIGANLGAALYEYLLARATGAVVRRRRPDEPIATVVHTGGRRDGRATRNGRRWSVRN